ncbi:unnamed protein product [Schistosoma margrebowiei]|uniref:Uncharacterized protein n=1 Tax=Schistosoma margrebowiei TaxID=48269 RepID=A0A183MKD8_9TREM|nr:unnamed protein product [Schistosoma margrebowiei]
MVHSIKHEKHLVIQSYHLRFVLLNTYQQGVPVVLRELMLPDRFDLVSSCFTVRKVTTELFGPLSSYIELSKSIK